MIKNEMARVLALMVGSAFVLAVSGCAFSGPGTHPGGDGFTDVGSPTSDVTEEKPIPEDPVPR